MILRDGQNYKQSSTEMSTKCRTKLHNKDEALLTLKTAIHDIRASYFHHGGAKGATAMMVFDYEWLYWLDDVVEYLKRHDCVPNNYHETYKKRED